MFLVFYRYARAMWRRESTRGLVFASLAAIGVGTVFYRYVEELSWTDSWYFTVVTLTTVGYGDIAPQTGFGKMFTSFYLLLGVGLIVSMGASLVSVAGEERRATKARREAEARADPPPPDD